jgi:hypothetical protein
MQKDPAHDWDDIPQEVPPPGPDPLEGPREIKLPTDAPPPPMKLARHAG